MENFVFIMELIGTVAFAVSGAITGMEKKMDIFGVAILGLTTAVGGGIIRDMLIGNTPPQTFQDPVYAVISIVTAIIVFYLAGRRKNSMSPHLWDILLLVMDTLGLGIFTVVGVNTGIRQGYMDNVFLLVFLGTITGVGGGLLRDMMASVPPYIFVKHIYACASIIGAVVCVYMNRFVGNVQAMLEYTRRFAEPFSSLAGMAGSFGAAKAAGDRIFALLDAEEELPDAEHGIIPKDHSGSVTFQNVQFGYTPDRLLMNGVNLTVNPGQKGAIVGPTGAGKTTLINLLMRFYEINGGAITVDGVNIQDMPREELRDRFGMVLQDTWLFEGTIADNLGYAEEHMDRNKIIAAAKSACAHNFIKTLPGGYDMALSKGAENISQGERQLLTIARAIASDPEIMILDEATSGLDPVVRDDVLDLLNDFTRDENHAVLVSSHIVSDLEKICDYIAFMHQGQLVLCEEKDRLTELYGLIRCSAEQLKELNPQAVIGKRESPYGVEAVVRRAELPAGWEVSPIDIEELFVMMVRGRA